MMPLQPRDSSVRGIICRSKFRLSILVLAIGCSRKPSAPPDAGSDAAAPVATADAGHCDRVARYVGSHKCWLGGGPEDGSSCDDFYVSRFGARTIVRPPPDEFGFVSGSAVADGDGPLRLTSELAIGYPKELLDVAAVLYFQTSYAGSWPDRFFLVWRSLEEKPRVKVAPWRNGRWGAPIFDHRVPIDVFPETQTGDTGETTLLLGNETFLLAPQAVTPVRRRDGGTTKRVSRIGCIALPILARDDGGAGYHEGPGGLALDVTYDDGSWLHAHRDESSSSGGTSRTYFLFRSP